LTRETIHGGKFALFSKNRADVKKEHELIVQYTKEEISKK
jgi:hypothetical protein